MTANLRLRRLAAACLLIGTAFVSGTTPAQATFPAANGRIVFSDFTTGQLYTINPDGTGLFQVTHLRGSAQAFGATWAPNGKRLAFSSDVTGEIRIHTIRVDGTHSRLVAHDRPGFRDFTPRYTPDGKTIVFSRCKPDDGVCAIWAMAGNGSHKRALTPFREGEDETVDFYPSVSPDGARVAFGRFFADGFLARVFVMSINGRNPHAVTRPVLEGCSPDWSPDGRRVLFFSNCARPNNQIYVVRPNGEGLKQLTDPPYPQNDFSGSFAPEGDKIAFSTDRGHPDFCCTDLAVMNADGTGLRKISLPGLPGAIDPVWGPASTVATASTHLGAKDGPPRRLAPSANACEAVQGVKGLRLARCTDRRWK